MEATLLKTRGDEELTRGNITAAHMAYTRASLIAAHDPLFARAVRRCDIMLQLNTLKMTR